jgi:hypothetical protein
MLARPTALAPLGTIIRGLGATLEGIGAGIADTFSREKCLALLPLLSYAPVLPLCNCTDTRAQQQLCMHTSTAAVMHAWRANQQLCMKAALHVPPYLHRYAAASLKHEIFSTFVSRSSACCIAAACCTAAGLPGPAE